MVSRVPRTHRMDGEGLLGRKIIWLEFDVFIIFYNKYDNRSRMSRGSFSLWFQLILKNFVLLIIKNLKDLFLIYIIDGLYVHNYS